MYDKLPMFTRIGIAALKPNLTNTIKLCNILQNPELDFKSIHIAGTNGKGSTSHILASVLHEAGFKVGLYTSPHLKDFRERIRINGKMISKKFIVDFVKKHKSEFEEIKPSFFEMTVGLCFDYFSKNKIDIAVIETGLGGRLDSTNIITPLLSVITNIGYDHMELLGETLDKIAYEKAGIIKKNIPVVVGEYLPETKSVFIKTAKKNKSKLEFAEDIFACVNFKQTKNRSKCSILKSGEIIYKKLESDLAGIYQQKNFVTSISAIEQLQLQGFKITEKNILNGFAKVKRNTGLMGRWQILNQKPLTVCDTGHNVNGIEYVVKQIAMQKFRKLHFVIGMVKDKEIKKIVKLLPQKAVYYFCKANLPRSLDEKKLQKYASHFGLKGKTYSSVNDAFANAKKNAENDDMIFVGGSTFVVAEVI